MSEYPEWMIGKIPEYMQGGVMRWVMDGIDGGSFMMAVMENDFYMAISAADGQNGIPSTLKDWRDTLNMLPAGCWGSKERVKEWRRVGGLNGLERLKGEKDGPDT